MYILPIAAKEQVVLPAHSWLATFDVQTAYQLDKDNYCFGGRQGQRSRGSAPCSPPTRPFPFSGLSQSALRILAASRAAGCPGHSSGFVQCHLPNQLHMHLPGIVRLHRKRRSLLGRRRRRRPVHAHPHHSPLHLTYTYLSRSQCSDGPIDPCISDSDPEISGVGTNGGTVLAAAVAPIGVGSQLTPLILLLPIAGGGFRLSDLFGALGLSLGGGLGIFSTLLVLVAILIVVRWSEGQCGCTGPSPTMRLYPTPPHLSPLQPAFGSGMLETTTTTTTEDAVWQVAVRNLRGASPDRPSRARRTGPRTWMTAEACGGLLPAAWASERCWRRPLSAASVPAWRVLRAFGKPAAMSRTWPGRLLVRPDPPRPALCHACPPSVSMPRLATPCTWHQPLDMARAAATPTHACYLKTISAHFWPPEVSTSTSLS